MGWKTLKFWREILLKNTKCSAAFNNHYSMGFFVLLVPRNWNIKFVFFFNFELMKLNFVIILR